MNPNAPRPIPFPELCRAFREDPRSLLWKVPGIHLVDKPSGLTSHDVVARMRRRLALSRVGHGGTLDPLATGLLLILAGNATRLFGDLQAFPKTYETTLRLGLVTDTQDITGRVLEEREVPALSDEAVEEALSRFR
ncbi:MAG: hypothetical protein V1918_06525, partial [Planctomycetota bacterium]